MNLGQHDEVHFTLQEDRFNPPEDTIFTWSRLVRMALPLKSIVDERIANASGYRPRGGVLGIYNAIIYKTVFARLAFASMPNTRIIMVLCSPAKRMLRDVSFASCNGTGAACRHTLARTLDQVNGPVA